MSEDHVCAGELQRWLGTYHIFTQWLNPYEINAGTHSSRDSLQLAPMPDSYDLDRGLLLAVQAIQVILY